MSAPSVIDGAWDSPDGGRIAYRIWRPATARGLIVVVHGFGEHGGRYAPVAEQFAAGRLAVAVPDLPGHGRSGGARGDIADVPASVRHLEQLSASVFLPAAGQTTYCVYGHSFGGLVAIHWGMDAPAGLRRVIAQSPLLETAFPIPAWKVAVSHVAATLMPLLRVAMDLDATALSHDPEVVQAYRDDPLVHNRMSVRCYRSMVTMRDGLIAHPERLRVPTLLLVGAEDRIVSVPRAQRWFTQLECEKRVRVFAGAFHELHHEPARDDVLDEVIAWAGS